MTHELSNTKYKQDPSNRSDSSDVHIPTCKLSIHLCRYTDRQTAKKCSLFLVCGGGKHINSLNLEIDFFHHHSTISHTLRL
jgi:hypothetical protein